MNKSLLILCLVILFSCESKHSLIEENVGIKVFTYEQDGKIQASAMPELRAESDLKAYSRRFEYLLINVSAIHQAAMAEKRKEIWALYPDTSKLQELYLQEFVQDKKLSNYFEASCKPISNKGFETNTSFTKEELMEVASKFFYCDQVFPDTSIQMHVCIGLNGVSEAKWDTDYTLLAAFCYEAIFNNLDKDISEIDESYSVKKREACQKYKSSITSLDTYLIDVRLELFDRMKSDAVLKEVLLKYYEQNKDNLAFKMLD